MTTNIEGVVSPVLTPFESDGSLATEAIEESVRVTLEYGCHAVVAAGTGVQETAALTIEERETLMTETIDAVDGDVPVVAGVSHPAQPVATELVAVAERNGADAVLAMPPWGVPPDEAAILDYVEAIASTASVPVLLYNNPSVTVDMDRETMWKAARIDGVEYVKESSRDWAKVAWLLERIQHGGHADVLATMDVLLHTLQAGGVGGIIPAPASGPCMRIYDAYREGDIGTAVRVQRTFGTFPPDEVTEGLTAACKAAVEVDGFDIGGLRPPYSSVTDEGREAIAEWLAERDATDSEESK